MTKILVLTKEGEYKEFEADPTVTEMSIMLGRLGCQTRFSVVKPCTKEAINEKYGTHSRRK